MSRRKKPRTLVSVEDGQAAGGEPRGRSTSVSEHASCPAHASGVFGCVRRPHKLSHGRLAPREAARGSVRGLVPHATPLLAMPVCFAGISTHLDGDLAVALEPLELKGSLLDDFMLDEGSDLLRGGRDARRQRDGDGARRGFQILGLEPRTRGGAHRRRQTNATASPPNGDEGSRTRPMRDGRQDRSWGVTHHVVPFPCASKEGEAVRATDAQILISPSLLFGLPISIPYPDSFAYRIASEIRKYGNVPHIITYYYVCHSVVFSRFKPPF